MAIGRQHSGGCRCQVAAQDRCNTRGTSRRCQLTGRFRTEYLLRDDICIDRVAEDGPGRTGFADGCRNTVVRLQQRVVELVRGMCTGIHDVRDTRVDRRRDHRQVLRNASLRIGDGGRHQQQLAHPAERRAQRVGLVVITGADVHPPVGQIRRPVWIPHADG